MTKVEIIQKALEDKKATNIEVLDVAEQTSLADYFVVASCQSTVQVRACVDEIEEKPDFIVLDPPREGIHPKALPKILAYGVERIVYISCKPTSLARDLPAFLEAGYEVKRADCVDMFPWTRGIETVVLLFK